MSYAKYLDQRTESLSEEEWEQVFDQIKHDLAMGEFAALFQMLDQLPPRILIKFLREGPQ
jgi:hypothetical protein